MKQFRIIRLKVDGKKKCDYIFNEGLNIIQGYHDAGKTNLIETLRFSLGGKGKYIDDSIADFIDFTYCEFLIGDERYTIKRRISKAGEKLDLAKISINLINSTTKWQHCDISDLSNLILGYFEIYGEYFRGRNMKNAQISFNQMYNLIYIPQRNWKGIQQRQQEASNYDRIATFKFAMDIESEEKKDIELKINTLKTKKDNLGEKRRYYISILNEQLNENIESIKDKIFKFEQEVIKIDRKIELYKKEQEDNFNLNIQEYKSKLNELAKIYEQLDGDFQNLDKKISALHSFKAQIEERLTTLSFDQAAYKELSAIPFKFCPSCRQILNENKEIEVCDLCKQKVKLDPSKFEIERETRYLKDTLNEVEYEIKLLYDDMNKIEEEMDAVINNQKEYRSLIKKNLEIDSIPLLDNFTNLYNSKYLYEKKNENAKAYLTLWDYSNKITKEIESVSQELDNLEKKKEKLDKIPSKEEKIKVFEEKYKELLNNFSQIKKVDEVKLSSKENEDIYFPIIDGSIYTRETGSAELIIRIVLYYLSFLILFKSDKAKFPPLLIIDTPRQQELSKEDYKKLFDLFYKSAKDVQIILCVTEDIPLDNSMYKLIKIEKGKHTIE